MILLCGDAVEQLRGIPTASVAAVITDPPYPEIDRPYGRLSEADWWELMRPVVAEVRRVLTPDGSALFILQANQERIGRTRAWLFEFQAWIAREWNLVQDVYWWNPSALPTTHANRAHGLMRPSVKACVWAGEPDCYRDQDAVLWQPSDRILNLARVDRALHRVLQYRPSGAHIQDARTFAAARARGGVTPFNLLPIANTDHHHSAGARGGSAGTPDPLCRWWISYLTRPGDVVLDPFAGAGSVPAAAEDLGRSAIAIERDPSMLAILRARFEEAS